MAIRNPAFLVVAVVVSFAPGHAGANDSVYTDLDTNGCTTLSKDEEGGGIVMRCKGLTNYPVYFKEGDVRQAVTFGPLGQDYIDGGFESFTTFNHTGGKIEWRTSKGKPVAAILRYFIENADPDTGMPDQKLYGQILVISRVAQKQDGLSCVAGYVDALAAENPNEKARDIADTIAPDFACGSDTPVYHGTKGDKAGEPMRSLPEQ